MSARRLALALLAAWAWAPSDAAGQARLPDKGQGAVSILYQDVFVEDHFLAGGARVDRGHIRSNNVLVDVTYGVTDRLTVALGVPFVRARYIGTNRHPRPQDDGAAHGGIQNLRFAVRYNIADGPVTVTPFAGVNLPSHAYEYFAHAALGTRVREFDIGAYVGRTLGPALPGAFVQARYSYTIAERIADIAHNRSNLDVEVGYFIRPSLRAFVLGAGQKTHGGIDTPDAGWRVMSPELGPHHDRIARLEMLDVGGGAQLSITDSVDVFGSFVTTIAGRNAHALSRGITVGASWMFGRKSLSSLGAPSDDDDEASRLLPRCLCQK